MKNLARFILNSLVDNKDALEISENQDETGKLILTIKVDPKDMGIVIGKHGKTINAIRDVIKILALKQNKYVEVLLAE